MDLDVINEVMPAAPVRDSIHPLCPGCDGELTWIDQRNPRCAFCGCLLYWPPTEERI
jgi:hypothetical protein